MDDLTLHFNGAAVTGEGVDCVGAFTFEGECSDDGTVRLVKQYVGRHAVLYEGVHDGEGTILGRWVIDPYWSGAFALSPERWEAAPDAAIEVVAPGRGLGLPGLFIDRPLPTMEE
jgi:hypothetical protein